jgi:ATP-dependent Clp protease ATP-binding subunit ClpA
MFERFTDGARAVVRGAQEEARRLRHPLIGTEHLLLAMLAGGDGPGSRALRDRGVDAADIRRRVIGLVGPPGGDDLDPAALATLGIDLDEVRRVTEASFGPGALDARSRGRDKTPAGHIPFSKRAKKVLELSLRESLRLGDRSIGEGHVLLGLIREGEGLAAQVLVQAGVDLPALRDDVTRLISDEAA